MIETPSAFGNLMAWIGSLEGVKEGLAFASIERGAGSRLIES